MDLNNLDLTVSADAGSVMEVRHPVTDEVLMHEKRPVTITLLGSDSSVLRDAMKARARKQLRAKKAVNFDIDEAERAGCELLAVCTTGWYGFTENGVAIEFSKENAIDLYMRYNWLRKQVDEFINDRENFFKA